MSEKEFISAQGLLEDSIRMGIDVLESGFKPNFIMGIWRGGTPVGIAVQELLDYFGVHTDHIAIRTSSYTGINQREPEIRVHGLGYLVRTMNAEDSLLIVDDVYDTGLSVKAVLDTLQERLRKNMPQDVRIATVYFKPENNKTGRTPEYYVHKTDKWLVFPHELNDLSHEELIKHKSPIFQLLKGVKK